jgi:imidazolonepropionase-like amidohydrolase
VIRTTPRAGRAAALSLLVLSLLCAGAPRPTRAQDAPDAPEGEAHDVLVIRGATVHTPAGAIPRGVVVVVDGKIAAVGSADAVAIPDHCRQVSIPGQHLYPGLIDMDTVLGLAEIGAVEATDDTREVGDVNPNLRAELAVNPDSELLPVARTGGVLLALTALRTGVVSGISALIYTEGQTWEDMTVRAPATLLVRWPRMRVERTFAPEKDAEDAVKEREAKLRALDDAFAEARAYWRARRAPGAPDVDRDPKWDALRDVIDKKVPVAIEADGVLELRAALDWSERQGVRIIVVGGQEAWRLADVLALHDVPVILGTPFAMPPRDDDPVDAPYRNAAVLHAAGVRLAFGTGGDSFDAANSRNLRLNAAQAVAYGLPPDAALHALTQGAADLLGVGDRVGAIAVGREATLFAADGDLFDTPTAVTAAWIAGRDVDLMDRQRRLYERYRRR